MTVRIDKGIPMPPMRKFNRGVLGKYPWDKLAVGDSFLFDIEETNPSKRAKLAQTYCSLAFRRYNKKFSYRTVEGKVRIWRTE